MQLDSPDASTSSIDSSSLGSPQKTDEIKYKQMPKSPTVVAVSPKTVSTGTITTKMPKSPLMTPKSPKSPKLVPKSPKTTCKVPKSPTATSKIPKPLLPKTTKNVEADVSYERSARAMLKRMDSVSMTLRGLEGLKDPAARLEVLKHEIGSLASDAATLISRGDNLVLRAEPGVAERLKVECQDRLREKWSKVMSEAETRKSQTLQAEENLFNFNKLLFELTEFVDTITERMVAANNHDANTKALQQEFSGRFKDLKKLNALSTELKIRRIGYDDKARIKVNEKWTQVAATIGYGDKVVLIKAEQVDPKDFITRTSKSLDVVQGVLKQFDVHPLNGKDYEDLEQQSASLSIIKKAIDDLKPLMEEIEQDR